MKKVVNAILSLIICFATAIGFTACSEKSVSNCSTGWTVEKFVAKNSETGESEEITQFVCFYLTLNSKTLNEIWVNIGSIKEDEVKLTVHRYNTSDYEDSSSSSYKREATVTKKQYESSDSGWIRIVDGYDVSNAYVKLSLTGGVKINEVVFINKEDRAKMSFSVRAAKLILSDERGEPTIKNYYTASEIEAMKLTDSPLLLGDEQSKFDEK